jgi:A/G-specific adenine glycosylase
MKKTTIKASKIRRFRTSVYSYFARHKRILPWRTDYDPYAIFISEIMLQQTQVDRVCAKFPTFIAAFPNFKSLADAPLSRIYTHWQGLGYNRRALNCKQAAGIILRDHGGTLPASPEALETLPGIGKATAASICAFAFNKPVVFLETNIRTAIIHHFFYDRREISEEELWPVAQATLDLKNPRRWYSALMDYGSMLKKKYGNASRRSTQYKKQSKFQGSRRQVRGAILKALLERPSLTAIQLADSIGASPETVRSVATLLVSEGLMAISGKRYRIP